jgi:hypothetical protein
MDALHPMTSITFEHAHWFQMSQAPPSACVWNDHPETIDEGFPGKFDVAVCIKMCLTY